MSQAQSDVAEPMTATATREVVQVTNVSQQFVDRDGNRVTALNDISLSIRSGEFIALVGPSGCGKTTLLNMIGSLLTPTAGTIDVLGERAGKIDRRVGYMFARDGLLPWRSALGNVMLGPEIRNAPRVERRDHARELLNNVGLAGFENAYPSRLSQGMRQRVAIARTLAVRPELILLDEPFAALDAHTRTMVQAQFTRLWEETASTVVMVTHDIQRSGRPGRPHRGDVGPTRSHHRGHRGRLSAPARYRGNSLHPPIRRSMRTHLGTLLKHK